MADEIGDYEVCDTKLGRITAVFSLFVQEHDHDRWCFTVWADDKEIGGIQIRRPNRGRLVYLRVTGVYTKNGKRVGRTVRAWWPSSPYDILKKVVNKRVLA